MLEKKVLIEPLIFISKFSNSSDVKSLIPSGFLLISPKKTSKLKHFTRLLVLLHRNQSTEHTETQIPEYWIYV